MQCHYDPGDRIELSPQGVLVLGTRMVNRGTVIKQTRTDKLVHVVVVHWDGLPEQSAAMVRLTYVQKLYASNRPLI